jgi:Anti-sigma-K factor rskA, C-terminal
MSDEEPNGRIDDPDEDRAVAAFLDAVAPTLGDEAVWVEPPAGLADSIIAAIAAERQGAAPDQPTTMPTALPTAPPMVASPRRGRRSHAAWWVGAAAAAAVAALAVGIVVTRGDGESEETFAIEGTDLAPAANATAEVHELGAGVAIRLDVHDLPPAPDGFYYQGWVRNGEDESVTVGTFHMRAGDASVTLWSGVDVGEYSTLTVTLQQEGAGPESSGDVYLRGSIDP